MFNTWASHTVQYIICFLMEKTFKHQTLWKPALFPRISHECNYGLEMLICSGVVLCGAEGVISVHSCWKAWQIDQCKCSRQIWCWWIYPQSFSQCIRADMAATELPLISLLQPRFVFFLASSVSWYCIYVISLCIVLYYEDESVSLSDILYPRSLKNKIFWISHGRSMTYPTLFSVNHFFFWIMLHLVLLVFAQYP